ncbi:hypothetical protein Tco_0004945 [Tanacetum coccineum]
MRREMSDMQCELLPLRSSKRPDSQDQRLGFPDHQDASGDADNGSHSSHRDNQRNVQTARPCFYADFMKCQPLNFKGTEGVVGLTRWIEKMEPVFNIMVVAIGINKVCHLHSVRCCFDLVEWSDKNLRSRGICNDLGSTQEKDNIQVLSTG